MKARYSVATGQRACRNALSGYVNTLCKNGTVPLAPAIWNKHTLLVKLLTDNNADINSRRPRDGLTPLATAIQYNHHPSLKILLDLGADMHSIDQKRDSILHYTAAFGNLETLKIMADADTNLRNLNNRTALDFFEVERASFIQEDSAAHLECRLWFDKILENARKYACDDVVAKVDLAQEVGIDGTSEDEFFDEIETVDESGAP